ncbi:hypothetical protein [Stutzerimonas nitrititolerans]|uniref:hypothetical protein n=1 Tax=Stutzerimonas nitrititolerans TaxID=2482751 RepID=UPI0028969B44|nr:hypothetical protein [Stutzerimonas nitrititolerans]
MSIEEKWSKFFYQGNVCTLAATSGVLYNITQRTDPLSNTLTASLTLACLALPISILCIYRWMVNEYKDDAVLEKLYRLSSFAAIMSVLILVQYHSKIAAAALLISAFTALMLTKQSRGTQEPMPDA